VDGLRTASSLRPLSGRTVRIAQIPVLSSTPVAVLDRYLIRQIIPTFLLALSVLTFLLTIQPMLEHLRSLLAKGVPLATVGQLLLTLLPQGASLTFPMAFLTAVLMALGRMSADRESLALLACGVRPMRILRPILLLGVVVAGLDMYVLMKLKPDANQHFREVTARLLAEMGERDIRAREFYERLPNMVLYIGDRRPDGSWGDVFLADTTNRTHPAVTLSESARLVVERDLRQLRLILTGATQYIPGQAEAGAYAVTTFTEPVTVSIPADAVFGAGEIAMDRGLAELDWAGLSKKAEERRLAKDSPHNEIMHQQQMLSFPVACIIFAVIGLALGLHTRKEGRLAGLTLGLAVILAYYAVMTLAESHVKANAWSDGWKLPAFWARWIPNIVIGTLGVAGLVWRARAIEGRVALFAPERVRAWWLRRRNRTEVPHLPAPARPMVVVRLPRRILPGPTLLDRYVVRTYLRLLVLALGSLMALFYVISTVDLSDRIGRNGVTTWMFLRFLWHMTPEFLSYVVPLSILIAGLGTLGALTRTNELMVMRACGISLYRAAAPLIALSGVWTLLLFAMGSDVQARSKRTADVLNDQIHGRESSTVNLLNPRWLVGEDGRIYHFQVYEPANRRNAGRPTVHGLAIYETADGPYRLAAHTTAERAALDQAIWRPSVAWIQRFDGAAAARRDVTATPLVLPDVEEFRRVQGDASQMTLGELREYVRRFGESGYNIAEHEVGLHQKLAFPAVAIIMTLLAIPFGATTGRKGALYGIALAFLLAGAYFLVQTFFTAVGAAGIMPPALAAWGTNALFAMGALYLLLTVRT
jgi:LPS export ABC transporter permease LptG